MGPSTRDPLAAERAHLAQSRAALAGMRERTLALSAQSGNAVSAAYLEAALHRRALALRDDPDTPLFFGRLDYRDATQPYYVGRRHVHDDDGDPMVVDWRAEVSRPFYRAGPQDPMGLLRRRRFGYSGGQLTAYEDEAFRDAPGSPGTRATADIAARAGEPAPAPAGSRILTAEIERPRVGPMRDIVATIQPAQDDIVRAPLADTVCVQGAPGTGKTAVGLHRAAYLLYAHRQRLARSGVLVIGPNRAFLGYIEQVLPALGEVDVAQLSLDDLFDRVPVRRADSPAAGRVKGDARMAEVLRRAVWAHVREPAEALVLPRGSRRWRIPAYELAELVAGLRARKLRYGAARAMLPRQVAAALVARMEAEGEATDERVFAALARASPVRRFVDDVWPAVDPVRLVRTLLCDPPQLAAAAAGLLEPAEQALIRWEPPPRSPRSTPWSPADAVLVDEAADLVDRLQGFGHVVLDEAQDLSAMQCRAVGRRCATGSATALGDIAQGTTPWATDSWRETLHHLGKPAARVEELTQGFRVPREIIDFASRLLPWLGADVAAATSIRESPGSLRMHTVAERQLAAALTTACASALAGEGSVGVIVADARLRWTTTTLARAGIAHYVLGAESQPQRLAVVPAGLVKGLEFDSVVVVEPAEVVAAEAQGLRRLYVALTRAVSRLDVVHARPLPGGLAAVA